jgi:hypothetical protein
MKVKQKSKQTPQRAPIVAINWLLKHPRELGEQCNAILKLSKKCLKKEL